MLVDKHWTEATWIKLTATMLILIVGTVSAVVLERMGSLQSELGSITGMMDRVSELDDLKERLVKLEIEDKTSIHAQLSSAASQFPGGRGYTAIEMELVDSIEGVEFEPRVSKSKIRFTESGEYLFLIAPQVQREIDYDRRACLDVWLRVNGGNLNNTTVRECWAEGTSWVATSVLVLQATLPMKEGDYMEIMARSDPPGKAGLVAIQPADIPLVPSVITTVLKVN